MITRRAALRAGMIGVSATYAARAAAEPRGVLPSLGAPSIDALLIDESIEMPRQMTAFIEARRRTLPVIGISLAAAAHGELMRILERSQTIVGISSGATLFCLERLAWDHGYRLTGRSQRCTSDLVSEACRSDVVEFLNGAHRRTGDSALARTYRPSRVDGTLHAWVLRKSGTPQYRRDIEA